ncbi:hypothetical protein PILCRDRAFT_709424 [Piloderma croceum F 1598]|uniref:F-box domain-containing protein n=1 Tax=Piloderma croceum (strain F 1598) TaxID=765440 RepID=A0A0C3F2D7_PILCF|nr:hypothetical protein PILCRDRAFT_709424 [Piloderma croceum F 1598]
MNKQYYSPLELNNSFWRELKNKCPELKDISITGLETVGDDLEGNYSGLFKYQGLESFRLRGHIANAPYMQRLDKLIDNFSTSSPFIHTLSFHLSHCDVNGTADNGIFRKRYPHLRVLALQNFTVEHPEVISDFWSCHPNLEQIELLDVDGPCFEGLSSGTLPKLSVLMASFDDVRTVVPLLGDQLINLTVTSSINAQVPYLLRSVLPDGLASLRSLGIYQLNAGKTVMEDIWEGGHWHEDEHGNVSQVSIALRIDQTYIMSIARGAPNLEELELIGECQESITSALSMFSNLKRLYISGDRYPQGIPNQHFIPTISRRSFLENALEFAHGCATLESITKITDRYYRNIHVRAKIQRNEDGIFSIYERPGCGRMIGLEDLVSVSDDGLMQPH